jgi:hypothetical protein
MITMSISECIFFLQYLNHSAQSQLTIKLHEMYRPGSQKQNFPRNNNTGSIKMAPLVQNGLGKKNIFCETSGSHGGEDDNVVLRYDAV